MCITIFNANNKSNTFKENATSLLREFRLLAASANWNNLEIASDSHLV